MLKPILTVAAVGAAGVVAWKVLLPLFGPIVAVLLGIFMLLVKVALVAGLVFFALWLLRRNGKKKDGEATAE